MTNREQKQKIGKLEVIEEVLAALIAMALAEGNLKVMKALVKSRITVSKEKLMLAKLFGVSKRSRSKRKGPKRK